MKIHHQWDLEDSPVEYRPSPFSSFIHTTAWKKNFLVKQRDFHLMIIVLATDLEFSSQRRMSEHNVPRAIQIQKQAKDGKGYE